MTRTYERRSCGHRPSFDRARFVRTVYVRTGSRRPAAGSEVCCFRHHAGCPTAMAADARRSQRWAQARRQAGGRSRYRRCQGRDAAKAPASGRIITWASDGLGRPPRGSRHRLLERPTHSAGWRKRWPETARSRVFPTPLSGRTTRKTLFFCLSFLQDLPRPALCVYYQWQEAIFSANGPGEKGKTQPRTDVVPVRATQGPRGRRRGCSGRVHARGGSDA